MTGRKACKSHFGRKYMHIIQPNNSPSEILEIGIYPFTFLFSRSSTRHPVYANTFHNAHPNHLLTQLASQPASKKKIGNGTATPQPFLCPLSPPSLPTPAQPRPTPSLRTSHPSSHRATWHDLSSCP